MASKKTFKPQQGVQDPVSRLNFNLLSESVQSIWDNFSSLETLRQDAAVSTPFISGGAGNIPVFSVGSSLIPSIMSQSGTVITVTGALKSTTLSASLPVFSNASKELVSNAMTGTGSVVMSTSPTLTGTISAAALVLSSTLTMSALTASQALFTNGSKQLVSNAITGTGNVVMSASPTLTGTMSAAALTLSTTLGVTGVATFTAQPIISSLTASLPVFSDGSKGLVSNAMTGTGSVVMSASPTLTGTITAAAATFSSSVSIGDGLTVSGRVLNNQASLAAGVLSSAFSITKNDNSSVTFYGANILATLHTGVSNGSTTFIGINLDTINTSVTGLSTLNLMQLSYGGTPKFIVNSAGQVGINRLPAVGIPVVSLFVDGGATVSYLGVNTDNFNAIFDVNGVGMIRGQLRVGSSASPAVTLDVAGTIRTSDLTASVAVFSDSSKNLVSNAITGTGNVVMSASPTLTGTITAAAANFSGAVTFGTYTGQSSIVTVGTITTGAWNGTKVSEAYGGTNQATYTLGDLLYASAANTLSKLAGNTTTVLQVLTQTGDSVNSAAPAWTSSTGTGNVVLSASPTLTGTITAAGATFSNNITLSGALIFSATTNVIRTNSSDGADNKRLRLAGGGAEGPSRGGNIFAHGNEFSSDPGSIILETGTVSGGMVAVYTGSGSSVLRLSISDSGVVNISGLTASQALFTDASKNLVSNAITGSGNVVMSASPTLTGTIAGAAMTLSSTLAVTSTLDVSGAVALTASLYIRGSTGNVAIGLSSPNTNSSLDVRALSGSTGATQYGVLSQPVFSSGVTTLGVGLLAAFGTSAAAYTMTTGIGVKIDTPTKGAGSAITTAHGLKIDDQNQGGTNYAIHTGLGTIHLGDVIETVAGNESTGAGSAALGANCPAVTATAPYKWIKWKTSDGSTVYMPAWK